MSPLGDAFSPVLTGLAIGLALAGAPGPVQAVLLAEAVRGGVGRGFRALIGASLTFGLLLMGLSLGVSVLITEPLVIRLLRIAGGLLLVWLAVDAIRSDWSSSAAPERAPGLSPAVRGSLAILLNPGAWLFLGAVASPLLATATQLGGRSGGVSTALALMLGAAAGDAGVVVLGAKGLRRASPAVGHWIRRGLATILMVLGIWLLLGGLVVSV
jgi:threonine/homoserine/homoserine lactone efflux protein